MKHKIGQITTEHISIHCPFCSQDLKSRYVLRVIWIKNTCEELQPKEVKPIDRIQLKQIERTAIINHLRQQVNDTGSQCMDYCSTKLPPLYNLTTSARDYDK